MRDRIAIVGIGCRYPKAASKAALWELLTGSGDAISTYAETRFPAVDDFYATSEKRSGKVAAHRGGFLPDIDRFDPSFFEIAPREAIYIDPQQRLLLEVAWEALEDAGQTRDQYLGSKTGVYVGLWTSEFEQYLYKNATELDFYMLTGGGSAAASGRVSFAFGLEGPAVSIDTACSSSLVALHSACGSLLSGETNMALAGGVNLILDTSYSELFANANMLSPDGLCKFGDASANGFVRSEGAGLVVLKRLADAEADGDRIYAVIRGSAVNNDGRTNGLMTTPSIEGQKEMLRQAWKASGIEPSHLRYIEAHGTGTSVGDPVEIKAIGESLLNAGITEPCLLGSIKTNVGHTETASGIAGVIKVALALHHRVLPPSLHFDTPNPKIPWDRLPVQIATGLVDLSKHAEPVLAGVNSFGLSGTNAHVVLETFPRPSTETSTEPEGTHLFLASAHTPESLTARLSGAIEVCVSGASLYQICRTAALRRTHLDHRAAITAENKLDLQEKLTALLAGSPVEGVSSGRRHHSERRVVFVAPGQGSQWAGMARELYAAEPAFHAEFDRCSTAIEAETGWSLVERILGPTADQSLAEIDVVQPALFSISVSLAALWRSWGVKPDAVVGHSMGEVAAAKIAGALSLQDAAAVICRRSRLMKTIRGAGAMATIELPRTAVEQRLIEIGARVSIAASNSPNMTVVAGESDGIDILLAALEHEEIFCRRIKVDVASHSSQVDPILGALREALSELCPQPATTPFYSTAVNRYIDGEEMNASYWANNLRGTVLFSDAIAELARTGHNIFVELSPHPVLVPAIQASLISHEMDATVVASLRREKPERATMLNSLGTLFNSGYPIDWKALFSEDAPQVDFPVYSFPRERCWPEAKTLKKQGYLPVSAREFPMLGSRFSSSQQYGTDFWEIDLDLKRLDWLNDHKVRGTVILPATGHIEIALEAARSLAPRATCSIRQLVLEAAITLDENLEQEFQIALTTQSDSVYAFEIRGRAKDSSEDWTLHSRGALQTTEGDSDAYPPIPLEQFKTTGTHSTAEKHFAVMARTGIEYGPTFRLFAEAWTSSHPAEDQSLVRIEIARNAEAAYGNYVIHPAVLDACLQSLSQVGPLAANENTGATYLPVGVDRFTMHGSFEGQDVIYVLAKAMHSGESPSAFLLDLKIIDAQGYRLASFEGIAVQRVQASGSLDISHLLFDLNWQKSEADVPVMQSAHGKHLLIFGDRKGIAGALKDLVVTQGGKCTIVYPASQFVEFEHGGIYEVNSLERSHIDRLFQEIVPQTISSILHLWSIDGIDVANLDADVLLDSQKYIAYQLPLLVQAITEANFNSPPRLWMIGEGLVATGIESGPVNLLAAPLLGAGTAIAREHPELRPCVIDISPNSSAEDLYHLAAVVLSGEEREDRIALRGQSRYVPRFSHLQKKTAREDTNLLRSNEEYRAETRDPGILDNLSLRAFKPKEPGVGEVSIQVTASGLNFIDVAKAMGIYPGLDPDAPIMLGGECAGRVVAVGKGVFQFAIGDEIVALTPNPNTCGLLASHVVLPAELVVRKPANLSDNEAASILIAYMTAYHSLVKLAHIAPNEWVLIHAGAGGVGIAAVKIAQSAGARIIATASSPAKHEFLKSLGVEYVLQSRSTDFAHQTMEITGGRGVDVILNSLSGEFLVKSLEILAPYGRFIELGKRDIYQDRRVGLKAFRNNISYHTVDIAAAMLDQRPYVAELLRIAVDGVAAGKWPALPVTTFQSYEIIDAFRYIAQAQHIGKVVIVANRNVPVLPEQSDTLFHHDASYIITGGLGGVGSAAARWMAANGAGYLILVSRRGASPETDAVIQELEQAGSRVTHIAADVSDQLQVSSLIAAIHQDHPPLKGVLHAAAAIDDVLTLNLTPERFATAMNAKVGGAWNLHTETLGDQLDFFILFSSVAALYPQVGVTSYAAANSFLDAFARYRRGLGLPATSINWGGWDNTGLAREAGTVRSIDSYIVQGITNFTQQEGLECLRTAIRDDLTNVAVFRLHLKEFEAFHSADGIPPIFSAMTNTQKSSDRASKVETEIIEQLASASSRNMRLDLLEGYLQIQLSHVLKLAADRIDRERTLGTMGLDSLMALEFIRRLNAGLGLALPATAAFNYPTIRQLAAHILKKLFLDNVDTSEIKAIHDAPAPSHTSLFIEDLAEEEAIEALMRAGGATYER